jgi:hypothetical protein
MLLDAADELLRGALAHLGFQIPGGLSLFRGSAHPPRSVLLCRLSLSSAI